MGAVSDAGAAVAFGEVDPEFPTTGVPLAELPLRWRCAVRTVEGVAGERPPCGARGVVLAPLSTLACLARGVVS